MTTPTDSGLPPFTLIIEWENAIDTEDRWAGRAMAALEAELARCRDRLACKPRILYLYDQRAVQPATVERVIDAFAPGLRELADVEFVPTPGLTYYKLKDHGVSLARTPVVVVLDSDAGPQPGWLDGLLAPFDDPEVMAVGGFTVLGHDDLLSRTMALAWIFKLPSERARAAADKKIHANNCAFRTDFKRRHPYPDLQAFKKQCGFWQRDMEKRGDKWVWAADAMTLHAPHPGYRFLAWRAWTTGMDRDFQRYHTKSSTRIGRIVFALRFFLQKLGRGWRRIVTQGGEVGLPVWQRPLALGITLGFFSTAFAGQLLSALTRSFEPLPAEPDVRRKAPAAAALTEKVERIERPVGG